MHELSRGEVLGGHRREQRERVHELLGGDVLESDGREQFKRVCAVPRRRVLVGGRGELLRTMCIEFNIDTRRSIYMLLHGFS